MLCNVHRRRCLVLYKTFIFHNIQYSKQLEDDKYVKIITMS